MSSFVDRYIGDRYIRENPDWHESDSPWKAKQIAKIVMRNHLFPRSICEIGCGVGRICSEIAFYFPSAECINGYDISDIAISIAKSKYETERVHFFCGDLTELELK